MSGIKVIAAVLLGLWISGSALAAEPPTPAIESPGVPGVDPLPAAPMSHDQLEEFFTQAKKGAPIQLTLTKGKTVQGLFSSYDDYYQTVWIVPRGEPGVFKEKSIKLAGVQSVAVWDRKDNGTRKSGATPQADANDDYYLLKGGDR